ncbi:protein ripply3 isoform X2 [Lepisosteus oculatus]|uniref:protein ripply3 isoform X2 n=1 Tax=Lepisosteus oculatus TaxID=7918 RepID=UPI00371873B7
MMLPHSLEMEPQARTLNVHVTRVCPCCRVSPVGQPGHPAQQKCDSAIWRPWVLTSRDVQLRHGKSDSGSLNSLKKPISKGAFGFQHPVRLYMPRSKTQEYLRHMGEKVLSSFPVQATIHFYNDDTESEEEEEEEEEYEAGATELTGLGPGDGGTML